MDRALKSALESSPEGRAFLESKAKAKRARSLRVAPKRAASRQEKRASRDEHFWETHDLRADVWQRAGGTVRMGEDGLWMFEGTGRDEVTGDELGSAWEMHHVRGGAVRRSEQTLTNVLAVSWETHRRIHRGDLETLRAVAACSILDAEARRAARHRVDKVREARTTPNPRRTP